MLLQTLVENAVKHGISRQRIPGRIDVTASRTANGVRLEVRDPGPGPDVPPQQQTSGERSTLFRDNALVRGVVADLRRAQAEAEIVCFQGGT